jgi:hypothetical protein
MDECLSAIAAVGVRPVEWPVWLVMHEIICPHCGKAFKIDEAGYADILKQVRDSEFEQQLHERLELAEQDKRNAVELAKTKVASECRRLPQPRTPRSRN